MFDYAETLKEADQALEKGDYAIAAFKYWLVNFAYNDEDIPYCYTKEIGDKASEKYEELLEEHKEGLVRSASYQEYKKMLVIFEGYLKYFYYYERKVRNH